MALKIGSEDRKKVAIAGVLGVIVLFLVGRMVFQTFISAGTPAPVVSAPPAAAPAPNSGLVQSRTSRGHEAAKVTSPLAKLDPTLHPEWMAEAESLEYTGKGRNIFSMFSEPAVIEAVKGPIRPGNVPVVPAGPPPPPPIDLKFFGYEASKVGPRKAFLLHGDDVFIASEGDVVDHRYKVVAISPFSMQVEDIPYHNTQTLPLVQN
jgi:hypothetical protein